MLAKYEKRHYDGQEKVWAGTYLNLHNEIHWHLDNEIIYIRKGTAEISVNSVVHQLSAKSCVFVDSGNLHYIRSMTPDTMISVILFSNVITNTITESKVLESPLLSSDYDFIHLYSIIKEELNKKDIYYEYMTVDYISRFLINVFRNEKTEIRTKKDEGEIYNIKKLLAYIGDNYDHITFDDAASYMGLSEAYFSRVFKSLSGITFSRYLNNVKIENAIALLRSGENHLITEVAMMCGYSSIRNFNREFLKSTGYSPTKLPSDYVFAVREFKSSGKGYDPTLKESYLMD